MIIPCGEALIDMVPRTLPDGESVFLPVPGGALFNTALALGRLEEDVAFLSSISNDMFGDRLLEALAQSDVRPDCVVRSSQPTTLAFVKLSNGQASYSFFDENSAGRMFSQQDLPKMPAAASCLHFGGISLIAEPCGSTYEALMEREQHRLISFDPNIRTSFITDEHAYRARLERMGAMADIIKVSDEDLAWMAKSDDETALIDRWVARGQKTVLITKGADGVDIHRFDGTLSVEAVAVDVVDTIGAGDTFNAGFLSGLREAGLLSKSGLASAPIDAIKPAVDKAVCVAALTCARAGANPPSAKELEAAF